MVSDTSQFIGHRYRLLSKLGQGGMGMVHRALDKLTDNIVALKQVAPPSSDVSFGSPSSEDVRLALSREFKVLAGLRHPHIISVLDYGFDGGGWPYFTMAFLENGKTLREAGKNQPIEKQIDLLVQILQALAYLHRRGILHRDLKPENILVVDGQVFVLDFGLSVLRDQVEEGETSGTLAYIAPEVLRGELATEASDLYAVGVIAYELFTGKHPYYDANTVKLINNILFTEPNLSSVEIDSDLGAIVEKLLAKDPNSRYQDPIDVIQDLSKAVDFEIPVETAATRESFLQSAPFTGREAELTTLITALSGAINGHGDLWLIGGESGVGKSRLLDEMRTIALVKGVQVLRGQDIREAPNPYQIWRDIVRRLCLMTDLNDLQIATLKPMIPDITQLLERSVPDAPQLDSAAAQDRLFNTIETLFRNCDYPLLLIMEDLHWTDPASLLLLTRLHRIALERPIFIIGTYRDDERPDLVDNIPDAHLMRLTRLEDKAIEQLAASMLGEIGHNPELVALLKRESSGNVFFLVEIVRALAEQSGQLANVSAMQLPAKIFAGGMRDIIQHRLSRVSQEARALLQLAAILGRSVDLAVLRAARPDVNFDFWLEHCSANAILEVEDAQWRFTHNKLRDGLLDGLETAALQKLHQQAAHAIEAVYPDGKDHLAALALHWELGGNLTRAAHWYALAGAQAEASYTPEAAIEYYRKALSFLPDDDVNRAQRIAIYHGLGKMLRWQAQFDEAVNIYNAMRQSAETIGDKAAIARALMGLGDVENNRGNREVALQYAEDAEALVRGLPTARVELAEALGNRAWGLYRLKQHETALTIAKEALDLSTHLGLKGQIARGESLLGVLSFMLGQTEEAIRHMEAALNVTRELGDKRDLGIRYNNLGEVYRLLARYSEAAHYYKEALEIFKEVGARDLVLVLLTNLGSVEVEMGNYPTSEAYLRQVLQQTDGTDWWGLGETQLYLTRALIGQGEYGKAYASAGAALSIGKKASDNDVMGKAWRLLGQTTAMLGFEAEVDGNNYSPAACYQESLAQFTDETAERAHTLKAWALYEMEMGNVNKGAELWRSAGAIYKALGMEDELNKL